VHEKSNEITAIPELLDAILVKDCIITIDAMGCQITIAEKVIKEGGDYILAVKGNQKTLQQNIEDSFRFLKPDDVSESLDADHGRVEQRTCSVMEN
jgi:predicted transposase YbfD/YdcC